MRRLPWLVAGLLLAGTGRPSRAVAQAPAARRTSAAGVAPVASGAYLVGVVSRGDTTWLSWTLRVAGDSIFAMDVAFSVELLRGREIGGPRAESATMLMAIGIAGDLQEALRLATSELTRWLARDHGLNSAEIASILGTVMRYDVADMVGSQVSIVATVPKAAVALLQKPAQRKETPPR